MEKIAMISQPMAGRTEEEIVAVREKAAKYLESKGYVVKDTFFSEDYKHRKDMAEEYGVTNIPVYFMARSLYSMSSCDCVFFCEGWEKARGCRIEHEVAKAYGLEIIHECMMDGKER